MSSTPLSTDPSDPFFFWLECLRGNNPEHVRGRAESGYWRLRGRDGHIRPIFLWRDLDNGKLCLIRDCGLAGYVVDEEAFCESVFAYAVRHPVTTQDYRYYREKREWPDDSLAQYEREDAAHKERMKAARRGK